METLLTTSVEEAAAVIRGGGLAAFPTETVYGLGASAFDEKAVEKIFLAKGRPSDNPLIVHIARLEQVDELAREVSPIAARLMAEFFPGPLTVVLERSASVPSVVTAGLETVGVRMPSDSVAQRFLRECGMPVAAPSANLSGKPSPTTWQAVYEDLNGRIDCILKGAPALVGLESTVVDCTGERPILLRSGSISLEEIQRVIPEADHSEDLEYSRRSPGTRHRHYSPRAVVRVVSSPAEITKVEKAGFIGLHKPNAGFDQIKVCSTLGEYAGALYEFFRDCDRKGIDTIYCEAVPESGVGTALMDRIKRASRG